MSVNFKEFKKGGFMRQRQPNYFSMRFKCIARHFTAAQLGTIKSVAKKSGKGYVHLTSRAGIEIPFIHIGYVDEVKTTQFVRRT